MSILNLILLFLCLGIGAYVIYISFMKKTKYLFRIRIITATTRHVVDDVGTVWKNKERVKYVKLRKMKELIPLPPPDAIDIDNRGRRIVECYRDEVGNYSYIKDKGSIEFFNPIDTEMNVLLAEQVVKANDRNNGLMANLPVIIGLAFVLLVFLGTLLFIGDALASLNQFTNAAAQPILTYQKQQEVIIDKLAALNNDVQIISANLDIVQPGEAPN